MRQRTLARDETRALFEEPGPRRRARTALLIVIVLSLFAAIAVVAVLARSERAPALAELRVRVEGVQVSTPRGEPAAGAEGQDLTPGEVVSTDEKGQAQVDFFEGSLTRLDSRTSVALRELFDGPEGRRVSLEVESGRVWNRVAALEPERDSYEVQLPHGAVTARGTTFLTDCRSAPECLVLGVEDSAEVRASSGEKRVAGDGDCLVVASEGLERCDESDLRLAADDWVRENMAEDELVGLPTISPEVSPSPSPEALVQRRRFIRPAPAPAPAPAPPTASPEPTKKPPKKTEPPKDEPPAQDTPDPDEEPDETEPPPPTPSCQDPPGPPGPPSPCP